MALGTYAAQGYARRPANRFVAAVYRKPGWQ